VAERDAVLFANEAFYRAFVDRDVSAMETVWSARADIACLHPGWQPLIGRAVVMDSWAAILGNPQSPKIRVRDPQVQVHGDAAVVICYEQLGEDFLIATNLFAREGSVWKLVLHQAGATAGEPAPEGPPETPRRFN